MLVQDYIRNNGIEKLKEEFKIKVKEYDDRLVLNYDQIESPKFEEIVKECRSLILYKSDLRIMARAFDRFFNYGEGNLFSCDNVPIHKCKFFEKLDGSLITLYFDNRQWNFSTRQNAFAEGTCVSGATFLQLCQKTDEYYGIMSFVENMREKNLSFVFELTTPENRVVVPYVHYHLTLLTARNINTGQELYDDQVDSIAKQMGCLRPAVHKYNSWSDMFSDINSRSWQSEGCVMVIERNEDEQSHFRIKVKNPSYLAISNLRNNGQLSAMCVMKLVLKNDYSEYLSYFPEDKKYFYIVQKIVEEWKNKIQSFYDVNCNIESQKEYALLVQKMSKDCQPFLFQMRNMKRSLNECIEKMQDSNIKNLVEMWQLNDKLFSLSQIDG